MVAALLIPALETSTSNRSPRMERTSLASSVAPSGVPKSALIASAPPLGVDTLDQRLGFLGGAAVVNQYMCTRLSKRQRSGSSNSTRSPRHQCSFAVLNHPYSLPPCPSRHPNISRLPRYW